MLQKHPFCEIILVNNGSKDNSSEVFKKLLQQVQNPNLRLVDVITNIGYGNGILQGLREAQGEVLCWTHADLQTDIYDCIKAFEQYQKLQPVEVIVKGKRMERPFLDNFFTAGMSLYVKIKLKVSLNDINAQPKLFARKFYEQVKENAPLDFSLDLYWLFCAKKYAEIVDIPVYFLPRKFGEAKGGGSLGLKWKLTKRTLDFINKLKVSTF